VDFAGYCKCLTESTVYNLVTLLAFAYCIVLSNSQQCPDCVILHTIFHKNGVILHACSFFTILQFCNLQCNFTCNFTILHACNFTCSCRKNFVPHHRKIGVIWCNVKPFNIIVNSEILLNLIRKMIYWTNQLKLCFCFCIG